MQRYGTPELRAFSLPSLVAATSGLALSYVLVTQPKMLVVLLGLIGAAAITFRFPKFVFSALLPLLVFEGAIRKWFVPGLQEIIYFGKDGLIILLLIRWVVRGSDEEKTYPAEALPKYVLLFFGLVGFYMLVQLINPKLPSLAIFAFGLKTYLLPFACLALVPWLLDVDTFTKYWRWLVYLILPICLLALLQSILPADHLLNRYAWGSQHVATFGRGDEALVRATATFSYISGLNAYLMVAMYSIPLAFWGTQAWRTYLPFAWAALGIAATIATGSRGPIIFHSVGYALTTVPNWSRISAKNTARIFLGLLLVTMVLPQLLPSQFEQIEDRFTSHSDYRHRIQVAYTIPAEIIQEAGLLGWGPASAHPSRQVLLNVVSDWGRLPSTPEAEQRRITIELGVLGVLLWYFLRFALMGCLATWFFRARKSENLPAQYTCIGLFVSSALTLPGGFTTNITFFYLWCIWFGGLRLLMAAQTKAPALE